MKMMNGRIHRALKTLKKKTSPLIERSGSIWHGAGTLPSTQSHLEDWKAWVEGLQVYGLGSGGLGFRV